MSNKNLYLEKYTIAPAPSRDYYGLKIIENEIKLIYWPISHGPHKNPSEKSCLFNEWKNNNSFQDEIERIFGESLINYIDEIVLNKKSLLTLSNNVIKKLFNYLSAEDIINLLLVSKSAYQIFKKDFVPQLIRKKYFKSKIQMSFGWKQLLQETQDINMQFGKCKVTRIKGTTSAPRIPSKNVLKSTLKPQLEITKITSPKRQISSAGKNSEQLEKNSQNLSERRLRKGKALINTVNLEFKNPNDKLINSISENLKTLSTSKINNEKKEIKTKKSDLKYSFLNSKQSLSRNISGLKSNEILIDNLVEKTTDEFKDIETLFNCGYNWLDGLSKQENSKDNDKTNLQEFEHCENKKIQSKSFDKYSIKKSSPKLSKWQTIKMKTFKEYDDFDANILKNYPNMSDTGTKKKITVHRKIS